MFPFASHVSASEQRVINYLRQGALVESQLLIEQLPEGKTRTFLDGWLFFLQGKISRAAERLSSLTPQSALHPFLLIQKELKSERDEHRFLSLIRAGEKLEPNSPILIELRALSLLQLGFIAEAEDLLRQKIHHYPHQLSLQNALATVLEEQGSFSEGLTILNRLVSENPDRWEPLNNLACMLNHTGRMDEAIDHYRRAIVMAPADARLRLNHSIALLKAGRFAQGWNEHEWRLRLSGHTSLPYEHILPSLTPETDLRGRRILITQEEGLGDTLMYLRYLPLLASYGAKIHVWGSRELANITQNVGRVDTLQVGGEKPAYDYHCPFISLPRVFNGIAHQKEGMPVPYLNIPPEKIAYWKKRLEASSRPSLRIGLVWAGRVHEDGRSSRLLDRHRSMHLSDLTSLFNLENISFYTLQKGPPARQLDEASYPIINFMPECQDMEDTGALIQALDLVISVDTSVVHLAGGMGKPVFMMDRFCNCWRWGYKKSSSPWYPSLRIFRQEVFDDWRPVISNIKKEIQALARQKMESA